MKQTSLILIILFVGSSLAILNANAQTTDSNFTIVIETNKGNQRREAYANYLATVLPYLGIDVELRFTPFSQFVNDLLFTSPKPYGISITSFGGGSVIAPDLYDLYHSQGFFGDLAYQLSSNEWKSWLAQDLGSGGVTQDYVDSLIDNISSSLDLTQRKELTLQFQQIFMEQLLYDYPLLAPTDIFSIWHGLDNFDPVEGILGSAYLGAKWGVETPPERQNNASTIADMLLSVTGTFDPLQVFDAETQSLLSGLFPQLLMFSKKDYNPHPWLAKEFNWTTWYNAPDTSGGTVDIPYGRMDFYLYDNWQWRYPNGTVFGPVTVDDVKFTYDVIKADHTLISIQSELDGVDHIEVNATENRVSLFITQPGIDDLYNFGKIPIIPSGLLGGDLTFANGTIIRALENTSAPLAYWQYDPFQTQEWDAFENNPVQAGPYYIDFSDPNQYSPGQYVYKWANPLFPFPNEWDSTNFDQRTPEPEDAYFFTWADDPNTPEKEKPSEMTINQFYHPISSDINLELQLFKSGEVDLTSPINFGSAEVKAQLDDSKFDVHTTPTLASADLLIFNLLDPNLKKYNVRRAIAHMVDKVSLNYITMNLREPQDSPVRTFYKNTFYSDQWKIPFDYEAAKLLMQFEGYSVPDLPLQMPVMSLTGLKFDRMDDSLQMGGSYSAFIADEMPETPSETTTSSIPWLWLLGIVGLPIIARKRFTGKLKRY